MKRKPEPRFIPPDHKLVFIGHLEEEIKRLRGEVDFYRAKVENLELAIMEFKSEPSQRYVQRADRPTIAETPVKEAPKQPNFQELKAKWESMSADEQEKAVQEGSLMFEKP